jgi:hypothetical protein
MSTVPFTLLGIDHDVIRARDIKTMMSFYLDVLNCEIERKVPDIGLYQLRAGRALIDFVDMNSTLGAEGGAPPGQKPIIWIICAFGLNLGNQKQSLRTLKNTM